jgi:ELWxxDGT repeat protein
VTFYEGSGIPFAVLDNQLFIALDDLVHGSGLWASDGSVAGTRLLRAFQPATAYTPLSLYALAPAGGRVFFSADDGVHGFELWESDGTAAGTRLVQDILPGPAGSNPGGRAQAGDLLFFAADDGLTGAELWALPLTGSTLCRPAPTALCLADDRFKVEAYWRDFQGNSGAGQAVALTPDTGYFWFFSPDAVEVIGKLIDGRPLNGNFWFFYGALSNVEYSLTVTDTASGAARRYLNPSGQLASVGDTAAFGPQGAFGVTDPANGPAGAAPAAAPATGDHAATQGATPAGAPAARRRAMVTLSGQTTSGARTGSTGAGAATWHASGEAGRAGQGATSEDGACSPGAATLCLGGQRFAATVSWQDFSGRTGAGTAVDLTPDTGYFWFFSPDAVELVLKVLDGRAVNGKFWVFYGALSNVAYTITIRDTATGNIRTYTNPAGQFASVADTGAF